LLAALEIAFGQDQAGFCRGDLALGACHVRRIKRRIDQDQQVALFDQRALPKVDLLDGAGDAGADFDPLDRLQPPGKLVPWHGLAGRDHRHGNRNSRRRCRGRLGLRAAASAAQEGRSGGDSQCRKHQRRSNQAFVPNDIFHGDPNSTGRCALPTPV
jgi:hypothetical protein